MIDCVPEYFNFKIMQQFFFQESRGTCDGKFRGKQHFTTSPDHAVFVALHKIRRSKDGWQVQTRMRADADGENLNKATNVPGKTDLEIGERIVWMSDDGPQKGVVKWIGCLPGDISSNTTVGVEFVSTLSYIQSCMSVFHLVLLIVLPK